MILIEIPGEIEPPKYSFLSFLKSNVIHDPASITRTFSFGKSKQDAEINANLSCPRVSYVLYKYLNGNLSLLFSKTRFV